MKILDSSLAAFGGTQVLVLELDDGEKLTFGLDGRMVSPASGNQIFIVKHAR